MGRGFREGWGNPNAHNTVSHNARQLIIIKKKLEMRN